MVFKDFPLTAKLNIKALLELAAASCAFGLISLVRLFVLDTCTLGEFFEELAFFFFFYNHTWHSLTIQLHGTHLQQDYKIYLCYSFTTYLFATYLH